MLTVKKSCFEIRSSAFSPLTAAGYGQAFSFACVLARNFPNIFFLLFTTPPAVKPLFSRGWERVERSDFLYAKFGSVMAAVWQKIGIFVIIARLGGVCLGSRTAKTPCTAGRLRSTNRRLGKGTLEEKGFNCSDFFPPH